MLRLAGESGGVGVQKDHTHTTTSGNGGALSSSTTLVDARVWSSAVRRQASFEIFGVVGAVDADPSLARLMAMG